MGHDPESGSCLTKYLIHGYDFSGSCGLGCHVSLWLIVVQINSLLSPPL